MSKQKPASTSRLDQLFAKAEQRKKASKQKTWKDLLSSEDRELFEATRTAYQANKDKYRAMHLAAELAAMIETDASIKTIASYLGGRGDDKE